MSRPRNPEERAAFMRNILRRISAIYMAPGSGPGASLALKFKERDQAPAPLQRAVKWFTDRRGPDPARPRSGGTTMVSLEFMVLNHQMPEFLQALQEWIDSAQEPTPWLNASPADQQAGVPR